MDEATWRCFRRSDRPSRSSHMTSVNMGRTACFCSWTKSWRHGQRFVVWKWDMSTCLNYRSWCMRLTTLVRCCWWKLRQVRIPRGQQSCVQCLQKWAPGSEGYRQVAILDGNHRLTALRMMQVPGEAPWAYGPILVKCILRSDVNVISPAQAIKPSKLTNNLTAFTSKERMFLETIKIFLNFAATFESDYRVKSTEARVWDVFNDLQTSSFQQKYSRLEPHANRSRHTVGDAQETSALTGRAVEQWPAILKDRRSHALGRESAVRREWRRPGPDYSSGTCVREKFRQTRNIPLLVELLSDKESAGRHLGHLWVREDEGNWTVPRVSWDVHVPLPDACNPAQTVVFTYMKPHSFEAKEKN